MVIDFDTACLPKGNIGWTALLSSVENAHPNDENEWIEFKANLDPTTVQGRFAVAKAIVAFANRDPGVAAKWLGGHAVIIVGLEPGNLVSAPEIDPADLYNNINQLLAAPAPAWDPTPIIYKGEHVLAITIDPPREGDPIASIGKNSGAAIDGSIYVRKQGKSEKATSADVRRLSARLLNAAKTIDGITIEPHPGNAVRVIDYRDAWLEEWLSSEERRLLAPLEPAPPTRPPTATELHATGIGKMMREDYVSQAAKTTRMMAAALGNISHQETRTEAQYQAEVTDYLDNCRARINEGFDDLRSTAADDITLTIGNATNQNYEQTLVQLHVEGDVYGYEHDAEFTDFGDYVPDPPRLWGPWTENRALAGLRAPGFSAIYPPRPSRSLHGLGRDPRPTINNGGSVSISCVPVHLYPASTRNLITFRLVAKAPVTETLTVTWTASAANVNGKTTGTFTIATHPALVDLDELLRLAAPDTEEV